MCPGLPIDLLARKDLEPVRQQVIVWKENKILAAPPRAGNHQPIAAKEGHGSADFLCAAIIDGFILSHIDVKLPEIGTQKTQPPLGRDGEMVEHCCFARQRRQLAPVIADLCESPFAQKARVEDGGVPFGHPTATAGRRSERIEASPRCPEDVAIKALCLEAAQSLQECQIVKHDAPALRRRRRLEAERSR
jgi:hypothetical protein